tara:strand:+ start:854 stop:1033 length:180 start_codon:yes stop_codon:yes gene_type:complete
MEDFNRLVDKESRVYGDEDYMAIRQAILEGTEPIVLALRDIHDSLESISRAGWEELGRN